MSGHSHWATIRRKKSAEDAKRGKLFTRLAREIVVAAREGGGDPDTNIQLQYAIDRAKANNMPKDNIERAIKRGTGELKDGGALEEIFYEGYAPHGVALMIFCVTDNRNRVVADIRHILTRSGGSMAEAGSVAWQFHRAAYFSFPVGDHDPDEVFLIAADAGADDVDFDVETIEVVGPVDSFKEIGNHLKAAGIKPEEAEMRYLPNMQMELPQEQAIQVVKVIESLQELDDVQDVYTNLKLSEDVMAELETA